MNIIELETPKETEIYYAPKTHNIEPFFIPEYGKTYSGTPCYQLRMKSPVSCLQYVIKGSGIIICDDTAYTVNCGDTFLLTEGRNQTYYSNPDNVFERIWINFKGNLAQNILDTYGISDTVVFRNTDIQNLLLDIQQKCRENTDPKAYKDETVILFLKTVQFLSNKKERSALLTDPVEKIRLYIDLHIMENLKISEIAENFNFTPEHIIRQFKSIYGITPHKYILQSKIRIAMSLLKSTESSIEEISEKLNFSDPHHFSFAFKSYLGIPPSKYRNNP